MGDFKSVFHPHHCSHHPHQNHHHRCLLISKEFASWSQTLMRWRPLLGGACSAPLQLLGNVTDLMILPGRENATHCNYCNCTRMSQTWWQPFLKMHLIAIITIGGECHRHDESATIFNTMLGNSYQAGSPMQLRARECHRLSVIIFDTIPGTTKPTSPVLENAKYFMTMHQV